MKRVLTVILTLGLLLAGCKKSSDDPQVIRKQIARYEAKIAKFQEKIRDLESQLPEGQAKRIIPVTVQTVQLTDFTHYLEVSATIEPIQYAYVSAKAQGEVKRILVKEGDYVKQGQVLIEIDDQLIRNNIAQLEVQLELADSLYRKQKKLYEQGVASEVQYLQAKSQKESLEKNLQVLRTQLEYTKVTAPFSGIVDQINIKTGEMAGPGARLIYLVNMDRMKAVANISENYLPNIHKGDPVELTFPIYPDLKINTRISFIGNFIDPATRTFKVEAEFNNPDRLVKPNMTAQMRFVQFKEDKAIVIPAKILNKDVNGWYVYVVGQNKGQTFANKRYITLGQTSTSQAVVVAGLKPGEMIIIDGYNLVRDGTPVKIK